MAKLFASLSSVALILIYLIEIQADSINRQAKQFTFQNVNEAYLHPFLFNSPAFPAIPVGPVVDLTPAARYIPYYWNPDYNRFPLKAFETTCTSLSGKNGVCAPGRACSAFGGRPDGFCRHDHVCCINTITSCNQTAYLNNTYWQTPVHRNPRYPHACSLNIELDTELIGQRKPICQVRLDFLSFSIAQPDKETVCATDSFKIQNSINKVPTICGDNNDQHMYLHVPNSARTPSQLKLNFVFGATTSPVASSRKWNIKISLLPCESSYLAPRDCLQYFTSTSGTVRSFNWIDTAGTATRQLANQDYKICFRNEFINPITIGSSFRHEESDRKKAICFSVCRGARRPFSVSVAKKVQTARGGTQPANPEQISQTSSDNCKNDYLFIEKGFNPDKKDRGQSKDDSRDFYCGEKFNVESGAKNDPQVCTTEEPFLIRYHTNNDETKTPPEDLANRGNAGFCLSFNQQFVTKPKDKS